MSETPSRYCDALEAEAERDRYRAVLDHLVALEDAPDGGQGPEYWATVYGLAALAREALNGGTDR